LFVSQLVSLPVQAQLMETMSVNFRETFEEEYRAYANRWSQKDDWY